MTQLAIVVIVVLLPGILATTIADKLTVHSKWDSFKFPLYALVLGVLTYSLLQVLVYGWDALVYAWSSIKFHRPATISWTPLAIWNIEQNVNFAIPPWEIVVAMFLSVPVAFAAAACVQHKVITRIGGLIHVTSKYGDENLYSYFMNGTDTDWVYVRDKENNLTYEGRVSASSENEHIHELVLRDCTVYRYEDSAKLYSVPTAYLSREIGKLVVETIPEDRLREE
jgi:Family of unknown function (DUF6338)